MSKQQESTPPKLTKITALGLNEKPHTVQIIMMMMKMMMMMMMKMMMMMMMMMMMILIIIIMIMMMMMMMMMMMIIIIIIIVIIIIVALKSPNRDSFYFLLTAPRTVSNTYAQVAWAPSCANHVQHIQRLSRATCHVTRGTKGQLS